MSRSFGPLVLAAQTPKNGPDALEMGRLYALEMGRLCYPRKQTSVSYAADCDVIVCYGGAKFADKHLASRALR
jgi:hypothetical protein